MNYQDYLQSEHWKILRGAKVQQNPKCETCGAKDEIEVHHLFYRPSWFDAQITDLKTLCHHCHTMVHAEEIAQKQRKMGFNVPLPSQAKSKEFVVTAAVFEKRIRQIKLRILRETKRLVKTEKKWKKFLADQKQP